MCVYKVVGFPRKNEKSVLKCFDKSWFKTVQVRRCVCICITENTEQKYLNASSTHSSIHYLNVAFIYTECMCEITDLKSPTKDHTSFIHIQVN